MADVPGIKPSASVKKKTAPARIRPDTKIPDFKKEIDVYTFYSGKRPPPPSCLSILFLPSARMDVFKSNNHVSFSPLQTLPPPPRVWETSQLSSAADGQTRSSHRLACARTSALVRTVGSANQTCNPGLAAASRAFPPPTPQEAPPPLCLSRPHGPGVLTSQHPIVRSAVARDRRWFPRCDPAVMC